MSGVKKHYVVAVDSWVEPPTFDFEHDFTQYANTSPDELPGRIQDATIVICSGTRITREAVENASNLQLVSCNGTGTDTIDKDVIRERGLSLSRVPAQNTDSVSEHAFALYYALRRQVLGMHDLAMDGESWKGNVGSLIPTAFGSRPPRVNDEETLVVIGYGAIGKKIASIGKALSMNVLIAERKGATSTRDGRIAFWNAIERGTIFVTATPLDASTRDLLSPEEFQRMDSSAFIINVGRGGVINEAALAQALLNGQIGGAATDVFAHEPATKENCPLLDPKIPNLVLTPHAAWYSARTIKGTQATVKANIEGFVTGKAQNLVIDKGKDCT